MLATYGKKIFGRFNRVVSRGDMKEQKKPWKFRFKSYQNIVLKSMRNLVNFDRILAISNKDFFWLMIDPIILSFSCSKTHLQLKFNTILPWSNIDNYYSNIILQRMASDITEWHKSGNSSRKSVAIFKQLTVQSWTERLFDFVR